jgi:hypothetical protein
MKGFNLSLPQINWSGVGTQVKFVLELAIIAGSIVATIAIIRWFISYKHRVEIIEMSGHRIISTSSDKGKEIITKNGPAFKLFKHRKELPMPQSNHKILIGKGKYKVFLLKNGEDLYYQEPTAIFSAGRTGIVLEPTPSSVRHWGVLQLKKAQDEHIKQKWFMNPTITMPLAFIIMIVVNMIMWKWMLARSDIIANGIGASSGAIKEWADATRQLAEAVGRSCTRAIPASPIGTTP